MAEHKAFEAKLFALKREAETLRRAIWLRKYSPDQPRVPAGNPSGGQWTSGSGGVGDEPGSAIRLAGDITGFTRHGLNQAINRGVSPAAILDAVSNPLEIVSQSGGRIKYIGRSAVVILNASGGVITVWGQ